jgi:bacteriocin-like protein
MNKNQKELSIVPKEKKELDEKQLDEKQLDEVSGGFRNPFMMPPRPIVTNEQEND